MTHADRLVNCRASKLVVSVALVVGCASDDGTTDTAASSSTTSETGPMPMSSGTTTGDPTGEPIAPAEGLWIFTPGAELERTCEGGQNGPFGSPVGEYRLEVGADDMTFTLTYPKSEEPIHTCTRAGASFECPMVMIGGTTCESWDAALQGEFASATMAAGEWVWRFTKGIDEPFCGDFGDVSPCTVTYALTAVRTGG